jgi:poly-beta-hydroxyalkanoate depolymerase
VATNLRHLLPLVEISLEDFHQALCHQVMACHWDLSNSIDHLVQQLILDKDSHHIMGNRHKVQVEHR